MLQQFDQFYCVHKPLFLLYLCLAKQVRLHNNVCFNLFIALLWGVLDIVLIPASIRENCPSLTRADNFLSFWQETLEQLNSVELAIEVMEREETDDGLLLQRITFKSLDEAIIHAYLLTPQNSEPSPLVVYTHGYIGHCEVIWPWARQGVSVFGIDIRGYGRSRKAITQPSSHGYALTGIESEKTSVLRGAVCDYIRGTEVARHLLNNKQQRTVMYGTSFAGALASMSAAVTHYADYLVAAVPTFAWAQGRRQLVKKGSGAEINDYISSHPTQEQSIMRVLSYFDTMNFAPLIECDSFIGVGLDDSVVPAETVYAFINHLSCQKQIRHFPVSHTSLPEEKLWKNFEKEWLNIILSN